MNLYQTTYTLNAIGQDGKSYAIYFECDDIVDAENLVRQTGLVPDEAGLCTLVETDVKI